MVRPSTGPLAILLVTFLVAGSLISPTSGGDIVLDSGARAALIARAANWFPDREPLIPTRDVYNGPPNPFGIAVNSVIDCDFIEPNVSDPEGGVTPKFTCLANFSDVMWSLKVKYDQRFNPLLSWGKGNNEVYATPVVQRLLWALGFGADVVVPVTIRCHGCPIEPWTYIRKTCGLQSTDYVDGWVDLPLIWEGRWQEKVDVLVLNHSLAYLDWELFQPAERIFLNGTPPQPGWGWPEVYANLTSGSEQDVTRDALTVIAALVSHVDNYAGNQGFNCIYNDSAASGSPSDTGCTGTPFLFLHDVGCTLGYGWDLLHLDFYPNALDLKQWLELEMWNDLSNCIVQLHGIPGASWMHTWQVSEAGRALASRLLAALTPTQIEDLFTVAQVNVFRGDSIASWVAGWQYKVQRDIFNVTCGK